jgi:hypothetical protein
VLGWLCFGCGLDTSVTTVNQPPRQLFKKTPESVEVYTSSPPARPHVDLAILEVVEQAGSSEFDTGEMLAKLRQLAADHGCDAIHVSGTLNRGPGVDALLTDYPASREGLAATCIVYTDVTPVVNPGSRPGNEVHDQQLGTTPNPNRRVVGTDTGGDEQVGSVDREVP